MKLLKLLFIPIDAALSRIAAAIGALVLVQFPNFVVHYLQRLGGHIDELTRTVTQYRETAALSGKTLEQLIELHRSSGIKEIARTGEIIQSSAERLIYLKESLEAISSAQPLTRFFTFIRHADLDIARAAFSNYTPGFSFNTECILYAGAGLLAASFCYFIFRTLILFAFEKLSGYDQAD